MQISSDIYEELKSLTNRYGKHADYYRKSSSNYNEHSCRDEFINPLLRLLGWDVENTKGVSPQLREVIVENFSSETERPDYSLNLSGVSKIFVEAKKPSVNVSTSKDPALQARKYGWNANHKVSVLTNFDELIIYDTTVMPQPNDSSAVARYRRFSYLEYVEKFEEIYRLISRESVYSGFFETYFTKELLSSGAEKERVDTVFLRQINGWRVKLANSLYANSPQFHDQELLDDSVQSLINQIVFLRICEDKRLPVYKRLSDIAAEKTGVEESLVELLRLADRGYDSGLFEEHSALPYVDEDVLKEIIEGLYYPQSPYLFDIIEPSLFGQIYEMFLSEQLVIDSDGTFSLTPKREYVDRSVVATPADVAAYIVHQALRPLVENRSPAQIIKLRIADIACGSGIFLIEAFRFLVDSCVDWYFTNDKDHLIEIGNGKYKLPFIEKKDILTSCLYGIDIDVHAVEVAKFSLLIELISDEAAPTVELTRPILPKLSKNIMLGNSLVSENEAITVHASEQEYMMMNPLSWERVNEGGAFDAIVGNPPYVKTEDIHRLLPNSEFQIYKTFYNSSYKQFDKYYLFIERAISRLSPGGRACLIVPNKFFKVASGQKLRELIASRKILFSLDDFGDAQLFSDKTIYSSILCLENKVQNSFVYSNVSNTAELWNNSPNQTIVLNASSIGRDPWRLTTDIAFMKQLQNIETVASPISNFIEVFNGIQTSAERRRTYWFLDTDIRGQDDCSITFFRDGLNWPIEKSILRRYFKPTEEHGFNSYSPLVCDKWLIFPYDQLGQLIPIHVLEKCYPGAWRYLQSKKAELWPKQLSGSGTRDVPDATCETWYQYGRTQALRSFNGGDKIIVGILSDEPLYYIDRNNWIVASGGTAGYCGIRVRPTSPYSLEYMQAWLTNGNTEKIFGMIGSNFEGGFKSRGTSLLVTLPFIELDFSDSRQAELYENVVGLTHRIEELNSELLANRSKRKNIILSREKQASIGKVEALINEVYSLRFSK